MLINWQKSEPYRWIGQDEDKNYVLQVERINEMWYWKVFRDEDKIFDSQFEEVPCRFTITSARQNAEDALDAYLEERNNLNNILSEAMADEERIERENFLENELERLDYLHSKP